MAGIVKQNLYSVKIAIYKDSHGKKSERKQGRPARATAQGQCSKAGRASQPLDGRYSVSPRRAA
jgi:hypothetical protein